MASEITLNWRKKLAAFQREFSEKFEYLFIAFIATEDSDKSVNVKSLDSAKTIMETRTKFSNEEISLNGRTLVKNIEKYFFQNLGIACQIAVQNYRGHVLYFPIGDFFNGLSLTKANEWPKLQNFSLFTVVKIFSHKKLF